jgi:serine/threonine-protein kinase
VRLTEPGTVIAGRFKLLELLGSGGMGSVWKAEHLTLKSHVAIKIISAEGAMNEAQLARFMREAQSAAALRSPHVLQILDHGVDAAVPWIAMEMLEGESLAARITKRGKLTLEETSRIMTHIARAVTRAHEAGIVHRDLKPDNVFLVQNDDEEIAKVLDFGIAKTHRLDIKGDGESTRTGSLVGTPFYMSPEQLRGAKDIDGRADLWAMGVIAYECLVGKRPFVRDSLGDLVLLVCTEKGPVPSEAGAVPAGFDEWFERATKKVPAERFENAKELARELMKLTGKEPEVSKQHEVGGIVTAKTAPAVPTAHSLAHTSAPSATDKSRARFVFGGLAVALIGGIALFAISKPSTSSTTPTTTAEPAASPPETVIEPQAKVDVVPDVPPVPDPSASAIPPIPAVKPAVKTVTTPAPKSKPSATPAAKPSGEIGVGF